jgi:PAS domain S-box-containing protein
VRARTASSGVFRIPTGVRRSIHWLMLWLLLSNLLLSTTGVFGSGARPAVFVAGAIVSVVWGITTYLRDETEGWLAVAAHPAAILLLSWGADTARAGLGPAAVAVGIAGLIMSRHRALATALGHTGALAVAVVTTGAEPSVGASAAVTACLLPFLQAIFGRLAEIMSAQSETARRDATLRASATRVLAESGAPDVPDLLADLLRLADDPAATACLWEVDDDVARAVTIAPADHDCDPAGWPQLRDAVGRLADDPAREGTTSVSQDERAALLVTVPGTGHGVSVLSLVVSAAAAPSLTHAVELLAHQHAMGLDRARLLQELERNEARYRLLVERSQDALYRLRLAPEPTFEYLSPSVLEVTGFPPDAFLADASLALERTAVDDRHHHLRTRDVSRPFDRPATYRWQHADGSWRWLEEIAVPVTDEHGGAIAVQGVIRDVTDRKRVEEALRRALEREREAADELRQADEMKDSFLQALSHELRTPLTALVGYGETLRQRIDEFDRAQRTMLVDRLVSNAHRLHRLLNDLLDVDRLSRGVLEATRTPIDLAQVVRRVLSDAELQSPRLTVELLSTPLLADGPKLERVVENLVVNALKHTSGDTNVHVRTWGDDGHAMLEVADEGAGVPPELRELIFEPFAQGPEANRRASPGTGIGLALVRRLTELHGGTAWVEDRPGGGASFRVAIPTSPSGVDSPGVLTERRA